MKLFIPPRFNPAVAWFIDRLLPVILKHALNIQGIDISKRDQEMLVSLRNERLLYMTNHPSTVEPPIAYYVANIMGSRFFFMASRAVFNWYGGILGWLICRVGAFSVLGGSSGGRDTLKTSRAILARQAGKMVIYPEGMMSGENDNLIPFMSGAVQIGFWGLEDARKIDPSADIIMLPGFAKYIMTGSRESHLLDIAQSIARIEKKLGIQETERLLLRRFLRVGRLLLELAEKEYKVPAASLDDYAYRIGRVRHAILEKAATRLKHKMDPHSDSIERIRELLAVVDAVDAGLPSKNGVTKDTEDFLAAREDLKKVHTFIVILPEYLLSRPTAERFYEWLYRFEAHVFGETKMRPRRARVSFAPVIRLSDYHENYKTNKKKAVEKLTRDLRDKLENLMEQAMELTQPIVSPNEIGNSN